MPTKPAGWKRGIAFIIDFFIVFVGIGYIVALITGQTTSNGFNLTGGPALVLFVIIFVYFFCFNKYVGGTPGKYIIGIARQYQSVEPNKPL